MIKTATDTKLGVIIVTYNSEDHITGCIESLRRELRGPRSTVVVVDNNSVDATWARLSEMFEDEESFSCFVTVANETNRGFGSAVNQGMKLLGDCDFCLVLNPDLRLQPGALDRMLSHIENNPGCGIVGPGIENETGSVIPSTFAFPTLCTEALKLAGIAKYVPSSLRRLVSRIVKRQTRNSVGAYFAGYDDTDVPKNVDWASGACLLIRRDALTDDNLFDDRFFLYYEDVALCRKVRDNGYSVEMLPSARATHSCHGSTGGSPTAFSVMQDYRSMFLYHSHYGTRLSVRLLGLIGLLASLAQTLATPVAAVLGKRRLPFRERLSTCRYLLSASLWSAAAILSVDEGRRFSMDAGSSSIGGSDKESVPDTKAAACCRSPKDSPTVSVVIPIRNEAAHIRECLEHICSQDYGNITEILLVDGASTDATRDIIEEFRSRDGRIILLDNPAKGVAAALNIGFSAATGDIVVRADAHALYAPDYVSECVVQLKETGAGNVGGSAVPVEGKGFWERAIVLAHTSRFGIGVASFRRQGHSGPVDTVWPGAFPRTVLQQAGKLAEVLNRAEDIDLNARIRRLGYSIYQSRTIRVRYVPRRSLWRLMMQSFSTGRAIVEALAINRGAVRLRHMVPGLFVSALAASAIATFLCPWAGLLLGAVMGTYAAASIWFSCGAGFERGVVYAPAMPLVFAAIHFSYGLGSLAGLIPLTRSICFGTIVPKHTRATVQ